MPMMALLGIPNSKMTAYNTGRIHTLLRTRRLY